MKVLQEKNMEARPDMEASFSSYTGAPPSVVLQEITADTVMDVGHRISGGAGPGGMDEVSL